MVKTVQSLIIALLFLFVSMSNVLAFEMGGLSGKADDLVRGDINTVDWPEGFLKRMEAAQASIIRKVSTFESWDFERKVSAELIYEDPARGYQRRVDTHFSGFDAILPAVNKCEKGSNVTDASQVVFDDKTKYFDKDNRTIRGRIEYYASLIGYGWSCDGNKVEFWNDDRKYRRTAKLPKKEDIEKNGTDQNYINDYLKRTKNLKYDFRVFGSEVGEFGDNSKGYALNSVLEGRQFVVDNCVCKKKKEPEPDSNIFMRVIDSVAKYFVTKSN